ncbi:probable glutamate receptor isoform X1 [Daphnia pulicaria]|uniref:probable glutamate receptor isoform X1 n=1 Tax=Daphnia pulicaria TaxID=35523 RepID=UPI001EEBBDF6|nr:probable glutamate receptor isoform X1 [Daphnia pulicaria]
MHRPSSFTTWICIAFCRVMVETYSLRLGFIHDERLDLVQPTSPLDKWMSSVLDDALGIQCPTSLNFTTLEILSDESMINTNHHLLGGVREFDGIVLAVNRCQVGDVIESLASSVLPLLRLYFSPCPTPAISDFKIERLELYRLNATNQYSCGSFIIYKWLEENICSLTVDKLTKRLLLDQTTPFSVSKELQECAQLNDHEWNRSSDPVSFDHKGLPESANWHRQLNGKKLRLTLLEDSPLVILERDSNRTVTGYKGYCYEIIRALQNLYNFTYELKLPEDNTFGKEMPNGSWSGMIGMIIDQFYSTQKVDIGVGPFSVTHSRSKVVAFSTAFFADSAAILIPPPAEENRLLACTKPFHVETWIALIALVTILPVILWIYFKCLCTRYNAKCPVLMKNQFFILGVLIGQSGQKLPSIGFSPRLLGIVWCLSAVVFASAYVGILISFLRFPKLSPIIDRLEDLPGSHLQWVVQRGTALDPLFIEATNGIYKTIGEGLLSKRRGTLIDTHFDGILSVVNGNCAYIAYKSSLEPAVDEDVRQSGTCRLGIAKQGFFEVNVAFALPNNSPLKLLLDKKILQMMEAGLGIYWKKVYWPPSGSKCGDVRQFDTGPKSLRLSDLQGAFLILTVGSGLAFFIFLVEKFFTQPCRFLFNVLRYLRGKAVDLVPKN